MNSLEALENIVVTFDEMGFVPTTSNPNSDFSFSYWFGSEYNTIKQDLERKEELEKENEDLKVFVDAYANARDELLIRNQKLKKAIEILEEKRVNIDYLLNSSECPVYNFYADDFSDLTQQEYELLKEVLKDE